LGQNEKNAAMRYFYTILLILFPLVAFPAALIVVPPVYILMALMEFRRPSISAIWRSCRDDGITIALIAAVILWSFVTSFWSLDPRATFTTSLGNLFISLLGILAWKVNGRPLLSIRCVIGMACSILLVSVLLLWERNSIPPGGSVLGTFGQLLQSTGYDAVKFLYQAVNRELALLVVVIWPIVAVLRQHRYAPLAWGTLVLLAIAVGLMDSMSAKLGLALGLLTYVLTMLAPRMFPAVLAIAAPVVLLASPALTGWALHWMPTQPFYHAHENEIMHALSGRLEIWNDLFAHAMNHGWIGHGLHSSQKLFTLQPAPMHPHHSTLQLFLELGAIGLLFVSIALGWILEQLTNHPARAGILATITAYLGAGFASFNVWTSWWFMLPFLCLLLWKQVLLLPAMSDVAVSKGEADIEKL
jgi:O-antigen ligase